MCGRGTVWGFSVYITPFCCEPSLKNKLLENVKCVNLKKLTVKKIKLSCKVSEIKKKIRSIVQE